MELRLEQLIDDAGRTANVQNMAANNPIVIRLSNPSIAKITAIVCGHEEPTTLVLPLNVTWFDYNPQSVNYMRALRRISKDTPASGTLTHTWEVIDDYDKVFMDQYYDQADTDILSSVSQGIVIATSTVAGIARLATAPENDSDPVVVLNNDQRLSDARDPRPHTHSVVPATQLQANGSVITIADAQPPQAGHVLIAASGTTAVWRALNTFDIAT